MNKLPKRKTIRIKDYDYSNPGAYFITICTAKREMLFWNNVGADIIRPQNIQLSRIGKIAEQGILQIETHYENVFVDKYCIMPDHIHLILQIKYGILFVLCRDAEVAQVCSTRFAVQNGYAKRCLAQTKYAEVAQVVEQLTRNEQVVGSSPIFSSRGTVVRYPFLLCFDEVLSRGFKSFDKSCILLIYSEK